MRRIGLVMLILLATINVFAQKAQDSYKTVTKNGAWCWFSDHRAIYVEGKTQQIISGWVATDGSIMVGSYNLKTNAITEVCLHAAFERDDHDNPVFLQLPNKKIMVFYGTHANKGEFTKYQISKNPEDITSWEGEQSTNKNIEGNYGTTYANPVLLSKENNRIYLFWRGGDRKPTFSYSDDLGKTWAEAQTLVKSTDIQSQRPYMKVISNGKDEIHFAFTDGHPRDEPLNSIYYMKYKAGKFYKADGTEIGDIKHLPVKHERCDIVYNATENYKKTSFGTRAWIWDIALDKSGNPVLAYTRLPEETRHIYYYAKWNGTAWEDHKICNAGSCFPRKNPKKEETVDEPHYSGGINIDHENTDVVYLSRPVNDIFEIFKYTTADNGKTWTDEAVTQNSRKDNVRPFAIRGAGEGISSQILWMQNDRYPYYTDFNCQIKMDIPRERPSVELSKEAVSEVMQRVADWQINTPLYWPNADWTNGALYAGLMEYAKIATDSTYLKWLLAKGKEMNWEKNPDNNPKSRYFADDYCVGQLYAELFRIYQDKKMIRPMANYFDYIMKNPSTRSLEFKWGETWPTERWSWCDALFMGPTVWAKMANVCNKPAYLDFMYNEYKTSYDHLYDKEEHLFTRDDSYFGKKEANGKKIFWGRGNGWVLAGLPIIIKELPADYQNKKFFETVFVEMAEKIASLQGSDGYWHASLLDPEYYPNPETSSSAFFVYGLAWGINNGYLDKKQYLPVVEKGWQALVKAVYPDGKLGWVQPVGADPKKVEEHMTEVYGVGGFLLAGTEMMKLLKK
jgi:Predicted unsaturated glucuronyl hydrolase involved in regulation of bacterial surface properties, and related proteins